MAAQKSAPHQLRVPCTARFTAAAVAFRAALKAAAQQHLAQPSGFGVPASHCYDLSGADAEVRRVLDGVRARFPADDFDLAHSFAWSGGGLDHLIDPAPRR